MKAWSGSFTDSEFRNSAVHVPEYSTSKVTKVNNIDIQKKTFNDMRQRKTIQRRHKNCAHEAKTKIIDVSTTDTVAVVMASDLEASQT